MESVTKTTSSSALKIALATASLIVVGALAYGFGAYQRPQHDVWYLTYGFQDQESTIDTARTYGYNPVLGYGYNPVESPGYGYGIPFGVTYGYNDSYTITPYTEEGLRQEPPVKMVMSPTKLFLGKKQLQEFTVSLYNENGDLLSGHYPITWKVSGMDTAFFGNSPQVLKYVAGMKRGIYRVEAFYTSLEGKKLHAGAQVYIK